MCKQVSESLLFKGDSHDDGNVRRNFLINCKSFNLNQYQSDYRIVTVSRPVTSNGEMHTRDPYHLPESYNYDWPYGEGLSH
jgi:hypothetical protein